MSTVPLQRRDGDRRVTGTVLAAGGGALVDLRVDGLAILARTPWADTVVDGADPALDEAAWVRRWRGGWQLCAPTAGQPERGADPAQGFHGSASQSPWQVEEVTPTSVRLTWSDTELVAVRTWSLTADGVEASTSLRNAGARSRAVVLAEHLVLGADLLAPVLEDGVALALDVPGDSTLADLDYTGQPTGAVATWPGPPEDHWDRITASTPARVGALVDPVPCRVTVQGPHAEVEVVWQGLRHALVWQEVARSQEPPWCGRVRALGVEPTTTPHGAGTGTGDALPLRPGEAMTWSVTLRCARRRAA